MLRLIGDLPPGTPVAFEAAFGWGWLASLLEDYGFEAHLVHPLRCKAIGLGAAEERQGRRGDLAQLLRADLLPEAWIAPSAEPPAPRAAAAPGRAGPAAHPAANRIHAVAADYGYRAGPAATGPARPRLAGRARPRPPVSREIVTDCLTVIDGLAPVIDRIDGELHQHAKADPPDHAAATPPGVGEFTALMMVAEIGDIIRFPSARKLASWSGLTPTVRGSDRTVRHGHSSEQGSAWLRWVLNQAAQTAEAVPGLRRHLRQHRQTPGQEDRHHRDLGCPEASGQSIH